MKETILVTGGTGYIGSHACVSLLEQGYDVVAVDNFATSGPESLRRVAQITGREVTFYQADLRDRAALQDIFSKHQFAWVIHFAGYKAVGESMQDPLKYYDNNIHSTVVLLETMQKYGCHNLVFSSSTTVYGYPEKLPLTEDCRSQVSNPYGQTKHLIEQMLMDLQHADPRWCIVSLRYFNPVGAHPSGLLGEDPKGIPTNLTPYIAQVATGRLPYLQIFGNDYPTRDGTCIRDYIHVCDLVDGHIAAMRKITTPGYYVYNLGTGQGATVLEVLHAFEQVIGREIPHRFAPRRPGDVPECYAAVNKAAHDLGWQTRYNLAEMCASLWNFYQKNPNGYALPKETK